MLYSKFKISNTNWNVTIKFGQFIAWGIRIVYKGRYRLCRLHRFGGKLNVKTSSKMPVAASNKLVLRSSIQLIVWYKICRSTVIPGILIDDIYVFVQGLFPEHKGKS